MPSLRTALALTLTAAAAAVVPAGTAVADSAAGSAALPLQSANDALPAGLTPALPTQSVTGALAQGIAPARDLKLDPLNNTTVDPLNNAVGSQVADFKPLSTAAATDPITRGGSLGTLPLLGTATGFLPH